jgi:hypothetical protein
VTAYVGATVFQVASTYAAHADMSSSSMNGMMHEQDGQGDKMPCNDGPGDRAIEPEHP